MSSHTASQRAGVREQLVHECSAMARYALASGIRLPPSLVAAVEQASARGDGPPDAAEVAALARAHDQLARLVAPATPRALLLMGDEHGLTQRFPMLGPVGVVRRMMFAAVFAMVVFIAASLTKYVDGDTVTLQNANGMKLFVVEIFWLSAAAIGASFAMLMKVGSYVVNRNYDPKYEPSYWIRFFLGVMAGFILVALVPLHDLKGSAIELARPTLAMLGGFSASAVYRILTKLVETVESLFRGDPKDEAASRERDAQARARDDTAQARVQLAGRVVALQQQVSSGADQAAISDALRQLATSLVGDGEGEPPAAAGAEKVALPGVSIVGSPDEAEPAAPAPGPESTDDGAAG